MQLALGEQPELAARQGPQGLEVQPGSAVLLVRPEARRVLAEAQPGPPAWRVQPVAVRLAWLAQLGWPGQPVAVRLAWPGQPVAVRLAWLAQMEWPGQLALGVVASRERRDDPLTESKSTARRNYSRRAVAFFQGRRRYTEIGFLWRPPSGQRVERRPEGGRQTASAG